MGRLSIFLTALAFARGLETFSVRELSDKYKNC